jgi:hypothetical protein
MKRFVLVLLFSFLLKSGTFSQELELASYLSNIVDVGNGSFGLIVGEVDNNTLSFVTVGDRDEDFFSGISVKFYSGHLEATGKLVKKFDVGRYTLVLYQCDKPSTLSWRSDHYDFLSLNSTSLKTFLDNGKSDNQWSNYREPVTAIQLDQGIATFQMKDGSLFSRGMPIINQNGSIVSLVANKQEGDEHVVFEAIDFSVVERVLYQFAGCKYFNLLRHGQKTTLCEIQRDEEISREKSDARSYRRNKSYSFAIAPAIGGGIYLIPNKTEGKSYSGLGYTVGLQFVYHPDRLARIIVKPRYGHYSIYPGESAYSSGQIEPKFLKLEFVELPVLTEIITVQNAKDNHTFALGYAPSFHCQSRLVYTADDVEFTAQVYPINFVHKLLVESSYERRVFKFTAYYNAQFGRWVNSNIELRHQNNTLRPFEGQRRLSHYFALEFSWRLWGNWLLKER